MIHRARYKSAEEIAQLEWVKKCRCNKIVEDVINHPQNFLVDTELCAENLVRCCGCHQILGTVRGVYDIRFRALVPFDMIDIEEGEYHEEETR
jgi:hypothetical protein